MNTTTKPSNPVDDETSTRQALDHSTDSSYLRHPIRTLTLLFLAWKAILFPIIANSPGLGYDTSANLLAASSPFVAASDADRSDSWPGTLLSRLLASPGIWNFVKWDAIYFVRVAERGYLFEQEWAWGYGWTRSLRFLASAFANHNGDVPLSAIAFSGIAVSLISHFLSVLVLHALTKSIFGHETRSQKVFCLISAAFHTISPAGAFLAAPYGESLFSLLNFTGFYTYTSALFAELAGQLVRRDISFLLAGILFATATTIRGNGILSGALFAFDAVLGAITFLRNGPSFHLTRRMAFIFLGGGIVSLGSIVPQYIAYTEYCVATTRPWCGRLLPSVYSWVQVHYWNNGFLKYWTVSNLPLFILAAPVLITMLYSSFRALTGRLGPANVDHSCVSLSKMSSSQSAVLRLAIVQGILAAMTLTSFHVQIVNRIASGYPVWYWCLATSAWGASKPCDSRVFATAVRGMAMYALIQAVLYGSFLPPA